MLVGQKQEPEKGLAEVPARLAARVDTVEFQEGCKGILPGHCADQPRCQASVLVRALGGVI